MKVNLLLLSVLVMALVGTSLFYTSNSKKPLQPGKVLDVHTPPLDANFLTPKTITLQDVVRKKEIFQLKLKASNTIALFGEVGAESLVVAQKISQLSDSGSPIFLIINSPGGNVLDGAQIVSAIQASKTPVYTVCLELCASMAAIIHQYGTQRFVVDRSYLMFHNAAGGLEGSFPQMKTRLATFDRYVNKMDTDIAHRVGISFETFYSNIQNELWLDGEEALINNYADKIVNITFDSSLTSDQGFVQKMLLNSKVLNQKIKIFNDNDR